VKTPTGKGNKMTITKYKLFTLKDSYAWALITLIPTLLIGQAFRYNYFQTHNGIPIWGILVFLMVLAAFWGITLWRFICRYRFIQNIIGYTKNGTAVTLSTPTLKKAITIYGAANYVNAILTLVNTTMEDTLAFWNLWATKNGKPQQTVAIFNGGCLAIEAQPITTRFISQKLAGLSIGNQIAVVWLTNSPYDLVPIIRHETGHTCLSSLGYSELSNDASHAMMEAAGF
jgi:hypothetical protein